MSHIKKFTLYNYTVHVKSKYVKFENKVLINKNTHGNVEDILL